MPFQTKSDLPKKLKFEVNVYRLLRQNIEGIRLSESQVLGLMANEADFYGRVAALRSKANRVLTQKQIDDLKKQIEFTKVKYGIK